MPNCPACGESLWYQKKPLFEGLTKIGDQWHCGSCGYTDQEKSSSPSPKKESPTPLHPIFSEEDLPKKPTLFASDEPIRFCRHCKHYMTNAFTQRCGIHLKEVAATDSCDQFEAIES